MTSPNPQEGGHTPGPWFTYDNRDLNDAIWIGPERFVSVAEVRMGADDVPGDLEANARLIAAAPALLEALKGAIGALEFSRDYHTDLGNEEQAYCQDRLDAALRAIAQATGGDNGR